ncbi:MAG: PaaI family thioesterase, partial [Pseudomonadota bacterium]
MSKPPEGFSLMPTRGPFIDINGPFFHDGGTRFRFKPQDRHCNLLGFAHGGIIATLLDSAMAHCIVATHQYAIVTEDLLINYKSVLAKNRWAEVSVTLEGALNGYALASATMRSRGSV